MVGSDDDRVARDGFVGIVGHRPAGVDVQQVVGVKVGPSTSPPNVYAKCPENVQAAVDARYTKKKKECNPSKALKQRIGQLVQAAMCDGGKHAIFTTERITEWFRSHDMLQMTDVVSGKWSDERRQRALDQLYSSRGKHSFVFKAAVKLEPMPDGKAPRFLIADGDDGQIMALAIICCFEDLLFEAQEKRSIKHVSKPDGVQRVIHNLSFHPKSMGPKEVYRGMAGDGSAWDTCCSRMVRNLVENPVTWKIAQIAMQLGVVPHDWIMAHEKAGTQKKLRMFVQRTKIDELLGAGIDCIVIDAIRRSGHRGTSVLNWWINFCLWHSVIFLQPQEFLNPRCRAGKDVWGERRKWASSFEGDDSGIGTTEGETLQERRIVKVTPILQRAQAIMDAWDSLGFHMVLIYATDGQAMTMVGWDMYITPTGPDPKCTAPELARAFRTSGYACSTAFIDAFKESDVGELHSLAAAKYMGRAIDFVDIYPTVSRFFSRLATHHGGVKTLPYDEHLRITGIKPSLMTPEDTQKLTQRMELTTHGGEDDYVSEAAKMTKLGYPTTPEELARIDTISGAAAMAMSCEEFRTVLPASWVRP